MSEAALSARGVFKSYRSNVFSFRSRMVLHGLDFEVAAGESWALVGANGAGKSTFLRCLVGLLQPDSGQIKLLSRPAFGREGHPKLGYMPDRFSTHPQFTVEEALRFFGALSGMQPDFLAMRIAWALERFGLSDVACERVVGLSKGMNQRLGLAQSLLHDPELIVWDEPSSGLDPFGRTLVVDLVRDLRAAGKTVIFSTHVLADTETCCDHVAILMEGRLLAASSIDALNATYQVDSMEALFAKIAGSNPVATGKVS